MAYQGVLEDIRRCAARQKPSRVPVFACSEEFDVRMAGETYSHFDCNAEVMARVIVEGVRRFDYDWAWLQVDDCIEFEVLGVGVKGEENILRATYEYLPPTWETCNALHVPDPRHDGRMPALLEALSRVREDLGETACVTGRLAAPFSAMVLLYGLTEGYLLPKSDPELVRRTCDFFVAAQTAFGLAQVAAGAHAIWLGDALASSFLVSAAVYRDFALDGARKVTRALQEAGAFVFYMPAERDAPEHLALMTEVGADAIFVEPAVDIGRAKELLRDKSCVGGNLDPLRFLRDGTPEEVRQETLRILQAAAPGGGFLLCSGDMVPRDAPEENMRAMLDAAREFNCQT